MSTFCDAHPQEIDELLAGQFTNEDTAELEAELDRIAEGQDLVRDERCLFCVLFFVTIA